MPADQLAPTSSSSLRLVDHLYLPMVLVVLALGLYVQTVNRPIFLLDHGVPVTATASDPQNTQALVQRAYPRSDSGASRYRPVTALVHWLNQRITPLPTSAAFRIVNIGLLAAIGIVMALWLAQYVDRAAAWLAAALFIAHPVQTESINHLVGRADQLALLGIIGFGYAQCRALRKGGWSLGWMIAAVLFAVFAVGSKETGLALIPLALVQHWLLSHRPELADKAHSNRVVAVSAALILIPTVLYLIARTDAVGWGFRFGDQQQDLTSNPLLAMGVEERVPAALSIASFYVRQVFWPESTFNHIPASVPTWSDAPAGFGLLLLVSAGVAFVHTLRKNSWLCIPIALAAGHYAIVGHLLFPIGPYATNRLALPFVAAGAMSAAAVIHRFSIGSDRLRAFATIVCIIVGLMMWYVVYTVNDKWMDTITLMRFDYQRQPYNPVAKFNLAAAHEAQGTPGGDKEAISLLREAEDATTRFSAQLMRRLAHLYERNDQSKLAAECYGYIIKKRPTDLRSHVALARYELEQDNFKDAKGLIAAARALSPTDRNVLFLLYQIAREEKDYTGAERYLEQLLTKYPDDDEAQYELDRLHNVMDVSGFRTPQAPAPPDTQSYVE